MRFLRNRSLPPLVRRWFLKKKRDRRRAEQFERRLFQLGDHAWRYREALDTWGARNDKTAHQNAQAHLAAMRKLVKRLAGLARHNGRMREIEQKVVELGLPGMQPYLLPSRHARRR